MAFKMTPGMKGNPTSNSIMGGGCGGAGQPPCPPRFQAEKTMAPVADRSSSSRSKAIRPKKKAAVVAPAPAPVKFKLNLPKGYEFRSKKEEMQFYESMQKAIDGGEFKSQEQLDMAVMKQLRVGAPSPFDPKDPIREVPKIEEPIVVRPPGEKDVIDLSPIKVAPVEGGESKAKSVAAK